MTRNQGILVAFVGATALTFAGLQIVMDRSVVRDLIVAVPAGLAVALLTKGMSRKNAAPTA